MFCIQWPTRDWPTCTTAVGVICAHDGPSVTPLGGTGYPAGRLVDAVTPKLVAAIRVVRANWAKASSALSAVARAADPARIGRLKDEDRDLLRTELPSGHNSPVDAREHSGLRVHSVVGSLQGLGRRL